ncbi:pilus assembly protein TadG-related protein [Kineosporia rhizophila]|uniref:pilus assembly protein TadG-related protein n=1 Tax=Kineosporia TaxID=49184 RepID=UPI001E44AB48|nr:pilus assembly protein TadG-related protein [Kineosporia sp. NBRC 101677]MCE0535648.1 pilus assembly protein TadG-related protein [Kineosporia rhizophila]GLY17707.1 membrane protein [Kineosporia sp. NBRC 101677]
MSRQLRFSGDDSGQATVFVVAFAVVLLVLAGLVVDGGLAINARQRVTDDVEQAARAGAREIQVDTLRESGTVLIDPEAARAAAGEFLAARDYPASGVTISADTEQVAVRATIEQKTALLSLIFFNSFTVTAQGQARPAVGITGEGLP